MVTICRCWRQKSMLVTFLCCWVINGDILMTDILCLILERLSPDMIKWSLVWLFVNSFNRRLHWLLYGFFITKKIIWGNRGASFRWTFGLNSKFFINVILKFQYEKLRKNVISRISKIFMKIEKSELFLMLNFWLIFNAARSSKFNPFWFYNSIFIKIFPPKNSNWEFQIEFVNKNLRNSSTSKLIFLHWWLILRVPSSADFEVKIYGS